MVTDSPTKGLNDKCQSEDLAFHSRSQLRLKLFEDVVYNSNISVSMQTWHYVRSMHGIYDYAHFDDLDLYARSQWLGKGKNISVELSEQIS